MKKQSSLSSLLMTGMVMITVLMSSCVPSYKKTIPTNAVSVVEVDVKNLCKKSNFAEQQEKLADLVASIDLNDKTLKKISAFIEDPAKSGIDLIHPVYLFTLPTTDDFFFLASISNKEDIMATLKYFSNNFQVRTFDNISWLYINNVLAGVVTDDALLLGNVENKNIYRVLLTQEDNFFASKAGRWMKRHSGDITAMVNLENLSSKNRRNLECTLDKNLNMLSKTEVDEIVKQILGTKVAANLEFKAGKVVLTTVTKGLKNKSIQNCNKRVRVADLKQVPSENLWAIAAIGMDGNAYWDVFKKTMRPMIKEMTCQEREELEAIEDFVRAVDGTIVSAIGGKKIDQDPDFLCLLPIPVTEVESAIEDYDIEVDNELQIAGNKKYSSFTNKAGYNLDKVSHPFKKAHHAFRTYVYAYINMEPVVKMLFEELACEVNCYQMKVYDKIENLCELLDYAELKVTSKNKVSLSLYLNDKSENSLTHFLEHGIKIGNTILTYNCNVDTSVPVEIVPEKKVEKNSYRRYIKAIGDCEVCNYNYN